MTITAATIATSGFHGEAFEDILSTLPGVTYDVWEHVDEFGPVTEAALSAPGTTDEVSDLVHRAMRDFNISGEWWTG